MKLLDLFCGSGGAAMGYHRAGFEVVGVDINPQPNYPFEFHQADALTYPLDGFDAVHASPPCQLYSVTNVLGFGSGYPDLIPPVRDRLLAAGVPYVIENVERAPLIEPVVLCGTEFGLTAFDPDMKRVMALKRHRLFESNVWMMGAGGCHCRAWRGRIAGVYGGGGEDRKRALRNRRTGRGGYTPKVTVRRELMGIDWMTLPELSEAIPPAYTEFLGRQLLDQLVTA